MTRRAYRVRALRQRPRVVDGGRAGQCGRYAHQPTRGGCWWLLRALVEKVVVDDQRQQVKVQAPLPLFVCAPSL